jgi:hypothetical protein
MISFKSIVKISFRGARVAIGALDSIAHQDFPTSALLALSQRVPDRPIGPESRTSAEMGWRQSMATIRMVSQGVI